MESLSNQKNNRKVIEFKYYEECHLTIGSAVCNENNLKKSLSALGKEEWKIVRVVIFGKTNNLQKIIKTLGGYPFVILGHSNNSKIITEICGAEIFAVKGKFDHFEYIKFNEKIVGAFFKIKGREHVYLSGLRSTETAKSVGFKEEVKKIYESIDKILSRYKFSPRNIYRFWNCMENILGNNSVNYALFNEARDEYFKRHRISDYPAATGIEAALFKGERINLSLEAVKGEGGGDVSVETIHSDFQCEAWEYEKYKAWKYGPKFSRAKLLIVKKDKIKKVYVSGTSNVDQRGRSILLEDYEKNISYVMSCVEHLLKKSGSSLDDIVSARVYFKDYELYETFRKIHRDKKWMFPYNPLFANICRENFFFEFECIAANKTK